MYYTYLMGWSNYNKFYYGVRYAKRAKLSDIGVTYFSSSKYVKQFILSHGYPDIIQIRRIFKTKHQAVDWESKVLRRLNVSRQTKWINRWDNNMVPYNTAGPFPFSSDDVQNKVDRTLRSKYGERGSKSEAIKQRVFETNITKYNVHHTLHLDHVKAARVKSNISKYGVDNPFKSSDFQKSLTPPMHIKQHRDKHKASMAKMDWSMRNEKSKATNVIKYGVTNPANRPEIRQRNLRACPFACSNRRTYDAGNFTNHMTKIHKWSKKGC